MVFSPVSTILRQATRKLDEPLNILTFPTHERYETGLCMTGHNFYAYRGEGIKDWNSTYAKLPDNYTLLDPSYGINQLFMDVDLDLVLCQNKLAHYEVSKQVSDALNLPLICLTHVLPPKEWGTQHLAELRSMRGHYNVFISEYSRDVWGWNEEDSIVIHHGIDTELFTGDWSTEREPHILSVVNDWINRDWACGYQLWGSISKGLPTKVVGDTPGLSSPAKDVNELAEIYRTSRIFLNTSLVSPVPTSLLEAMSAGCAVVSTATCMIPEIIEDGKNGYISNDASKLKKHLEHLLVDDARCKRIGLEAQKTVREKFSMDKFVQKWDNLFKEAANMIYVG